MRRWLACFLPLLLISSLSFSQDLAKPSHHVAGNMPVSSSRIQLSAERTSAPHAIAQPNASGRGVPGNTWQLLATIPGVIIHDIAFPTAKIGYAVGEEGQVWKTTDGGTNWVQQVPPDAASDYFYGVAAITAKKVIISGFFDGSGGAYGVFRWTEDGGTTWSSDMTSGPEWLQQVRFVKKQNGLMLTLGPVEGDPDTLAEYTSDGGAGVSDWNSADANPDGGWFGPQFSFLTNLHARASGINFCTSFTGGSAWSCGPSVDSVFDGPVFFLNDKDGWVGGGEISPSVEGWLHVTTNGGQTWSGRTLDGPWPIRSILFLNGTTGWAGGGNVYTDVGGMYFSTDGGNTWSVDVTTNSEMGSCSDHTIAGKHHQIWCAGFNYNNDNFNSVIYSTQY